MCVLCINAQDKKSGEKAKPQTKTEVIFHIPNMHGEHCQKRITENLAYEKGVKDLSFDLTAQNLKIVYDAGKTSVEKLKAALKKLDYQIEMPQMSVCATPAQQNKSCCRSH
jgi:copper chaperone CopZ